MMIKRHLHFIFDDDDEDIHHDEIHRLDHRSTGSIDDGQLR